METLARWQRELQGQGFARVISGTKGARPRDVYPAQVNRALAAVQSALVLLEASGQRYLLTRVDGAVTTGLKQAISVYKNVCCRAGIQSHSARYAFAAERIQAYRDEGFGEARGPRGDFYGPRTWRWSRALCRECLCARRLRTSAST